MSCSSRPATSPRRSGSVPNEPRGTHRLIVPADRAGERLDRYLPEAIPGISRARGQRLNQMHDRPGSLVGDVPALRRSRQRLRGIAFHTRYGCLCSFDPEDSGALARGFRLRVAVVLRDRLREVRVPSSPYGDLRLTARRRLQRQRRERRFSREPGRAHRRDIDVAAVGTEGNH